MHFFFHLCLAASLVVATPLKAAEANEHDIKLELGSPAGSFSSNFWTGKRFLDHIQTGTGIDLDLGEETTNFGLHNFGQSIEERQQKQNEVTPSSPFLVERQETCPRALTPDDINAIRNAATATLASAAVILGTANIIGTLGTLNAGIINLFATIFKGPVTIIGADNPIVQETLTLFFQFLSERAQ